jgi:hypothetical protein
MLPRIPLQVFGRYEDWRFARLNNVFDQKVKWYGGGLNYYVRGQDLKLTAEYSATRFDQAGVFGEVATRDFDTVVVQLQVVF